MAGNLNANLADPEGTPRGKAIADKLEAAVLMDLGLLFLQQRKLWLKDRCTCSMRRDGREFWSCKYYILRIDFRLLQDVAIQDPQHHSDHYMVLGCLRGGRQRIIQNTYVKFTASPSGPFVATLRWLQTSSYQSSIPISSIPPWVSG